MPTASLVYAITNHFYPCASLLSCSCGCSSLPKSSFLYMQISFIHVVIIKFLSPACPSPISSQGFFNKCLAAIIFQYHIHKMSFSSFPSPLHSFLPMSTTHLSLTPSSLRTSCSFPLSNWHGPPSFPFTRVASTFSQFDLPYYLRFESFDNSSSITDS